MSGQTSGPTNGHGDATHGPAPMGSVDPVPLHRAVDALAAALHEYVETAVGVRAEFGASEADEDPRVLALETQVGTFNAKLFDAMHDALGMHPDLTASVWEPDGEDGTDADAPPLPDVAEPFFLGFVVGPPVGTSDASLDDVIELLDQAGESVVARLVEAGFDVVEWAASRGDAAEFDDHEDDEDDDDDLGDDLDDGTGPR